MAKGTASKDKKKPAEKKSGEKSKGKAEETADKGKGTYILYRTGSICLPFYLFCCRLGTDREELWQGKGGLKAATAVNVRHVLCEKHSKAMEALQRIQVRYTYVFPDVVFSRYNIYRDLFWSVVLTRAGSDLTKLPRNVRRIRPKVS